MGVPHTRAHCSWSVAELPGSDLGVMLLKSCQVVIAIICLFQGLARGCDPYKFYYSSDVFDSAYVIKELDSTIMDNMNCADGCVYTKVGQDSFNEYCFTEEGTDGNDEATTEYRVPCST